MHKTNNPSLKSWINVPENSDFPIQNLPFGIFKPNGKQPRAGIAIGNELIDLHRIQKLGYLDNVASLESGMFKQNSLNSFFALGRKEVGKVRRAVSKLLRDDVKKDVQKVIDRKALYAQAEVEMLMPVQVGDYTDFYSSEDHARNVGTMFRDPENALLPNWKHLPVGYHGRASSIVVSGTPTKRPSGQRKAPDDTTPTFGPTQRLDFELEVAFITSCETQMGETISTERAADCIVGLVLFNDWSARDIQTWEYVPLGPFLAKSFASTISPWVVTLDALEPYKVDGPQQDPVPLDYLKYEGQHHYDINLAVDIELPTGEAKTVCESNYKHMYWNMAQQLAHQTVNGCNIRVGDMYASGTISGPKENSYGSMLEISWKGTKPVKMPDNTERKFINDEDTVVMRGWCEREGVRIGFGEVRSKVLPANTDK